MSNKSVQKELKAWRAALGITQEQAAELLGVNLHTLISWEIGVRQPPFFAWDRQRLLAKLRKDMETAP